ncbi:MAG TPA: ABC transporter permease, partial [Candidatus Acidoferrales bacterium]
MDEKIRAPRIPNRLLRWAVPGPLRQSVLGDLEEEWCAQPSPDSLRGRTWYWRHALALASRFTVERIARRTVRQRHDWGGEPRRKGDGVMETIWQDVRYGLRMLANRPGFTTVAVLTLALGIGANAAIFSVVEAVLLRPLPFPETERIVALWQNDRKTNVEREDVAPANFVDWRALNTVVEEMAAINPWSLDFTGGDEPETIRSANVTRGFFELLGVKAARGRTFLPEEYEPGRNNVVVLTHGLWQRKFGGDPGVVGQVISLDDQPYTIVGILPPEFFLRFSRSDRTRRPEMYAPQVVVGEDWESRVATYLEVIGKLKPGVTIDEARAAMGVVARQLAQQYPRENSTVGITLVPLHEQTVGGVRTGLLVLLGGVGLVLLIACANVANLLLARGQHRLRELAVRAAMGASSRRLTSQLLVEGLLLSVFGLAGGLALAAALLPVIVSLSPADTPRIQQVALNLPVLGFAIIVALLTSILFGLAPSLQLARRNLQAFLKEGTQGAMGRTGAGKLRSALVISEVALAMVLLVGAGLLVRSFVTLLGVDRGFTHNAVALEVYVWDRFTTPERRIAFFREVAEKLSTLPGVKAAGAVSSAPFLTSGHAPSIPCNVEGRPP